jgi:type II secretory pathway pseudopilin PulG
MGIKNKKSFTLIEIVVVISVLALALPAVFAILFVILRQQIMLNGLQEAKKQGDNAMVVIQNKIRNNAMTIYSDDSCTTTTEVCTSDIKTYLSSTPPDRLLSFKDKLGNCFYISYKDSNKTIKIDASDLTTDRLTITDFSIGCGQSIEFVPPIVNVSFKIRYGSSSNLEYRSSTKLTNY